MNRIVKIFETASLVIERFDHRPDCVHRDHDKEMTTDAAVTFVQSGSFTLLEGKTSWTFRPGDVLLSTPGTVRRYRHFEECPSDVCLSICFTPETVEDAFGASPWPSPPPLITRGPATEFACSSIQLALASLDRLWIEELAFHCMLAFNSDSWVRPVQTSVNAAHAHRIRAAMQLMSEGLAQRCSLTSISRTVGMSPFHFARTFSGLVGLSPHQYLLRLRLRHSATMLRQGASVTTAALSSGFDNPAHFSRSFRRRFGINPSKYARAPG
jgi:AraC family transcriptional regulator